MPEQLLLSLACELLSEGSLRLFMILHIMRFCCNFNTGSFLCIFCLVLLELKIFLSLLGPDNDCYSLVESFLSSVESFLSSQGPDIDNYLKLESFFSSQAPDIDCYWLLKYVVSSQGLDIDCYSWLKFFLSSLGSDNDCYSQVKSVVFSQGPNIFVY